MKKVVVLGGGTGMSNLLRGLKLFPLDITAVVSVCDDGKSTGKLREEFNIMAVGDLRRVIVSMSETEDIFKKLFNYRFNTTSDLNDHTVGNLFLTALSKVAGNMSDGIEEIGKVLNLKGNVLPLTEDYVTLLGIMEDESVVVGEHKITESKKKIKRVEYLENPEVNLKVTKAIEDADLIILSMGSLYTSIIPNLIIDEVVNAIDKSDADLMYVSNMFTQPGETDGFRVSDHIDVLNSYLGRKRVTVVLANDGKIEESMLEKYSNLEQKDQVMLDKSNLDGLELIENNYVALEEGTIKHNVDKLSGDIYAYLMR